MKYYQDIEDAIIEKAEEIKEQR